MPTPLFSYNELSIIYKCLGFALDHWTGGEPWQGAEASFDDDLMGHAHQEVLDLRGELKCLLVETQARMIRLEVEERERSRRDAGEGGQ